MAGSKGGAKGSHSPAASHKGVKKTKTNRMHMASHSEHAKDHMKAKSSKKHATVKTKLSGGKVGGGKGGAKEKIRKGGI